MRGTCLILLDADFWVSQHFLSHTTAPQKWAALRFFLGLANSESCSLQAVTGNVELAEGGVSREEWSLQPGE